jgi:hypothetical protein
MPCPWCAQQVTPQVQSAVARNGHTATWACHSRGAAQGQTILGVLVLEGPLVADGGFRDGLLRHTRNDLPGNNSPWVLPLMCVVRACCCCCCWCCRVACQVESMYNEFAGRVVMDLGCGTVRLEACHTSVHAQVAWCSSSRHSLHEQASAGRAICSPFSPQSPASCW